MKLSTVKKILKATKLTYRKAAPAFDCTESASMAKFSRGLLNTDDLIKLCDYCQAELTIKTTDGTVIPLTKDDIK